MATTRDIITGAYRLTGIAAVDEDLSGDQAAYGLTALNDMLNGWRLFGIDARQGDPAVDFALGMNDEFPLGAQYHEGAKAILAQRLSPAYSLPGFDADVWLRGLQAAFTTVDPVTFDRAILRRRWSI